MPENSMPPNPPRHPPRNALPSGVYALTDRRLAGAGGRSHEEIVSALLEGGARLIQIREKPDSTNPPPLSRPALADSIRRCLALTRAAGAALIVNDDPDLAAETGADGVHVGQDDCPPREARRRIGPRRILGISTHTRAQFLAALGEPVDYVAIGPIFGTTSKESPYSALGLEFARWASAEAARRGMAIAAIGGISLDNLAHLMAAAPDCRPAVISALMRPNLEDIAAATRQFLDAMRAPH